MDHQLLIILFAGVGLLIVAGTRRMIVQRRRRAHPRDPADLLGDPRNIERRDPGSVRGAHGAQRSRLEIRSPYREETDRFVMVWRAVQARFVDDPRSAVTQADRLLGEVLDARGFPLGEIEAHAEDIEFEFPRLVKSYRVGHGTALRHARGESSLEELRHAFVAYRVMFEDLLELHEATGAHQPRR